MVQEHGVEQVSGVGLCADALCSVDGQIIGFHYPGRDDNANVPIGSKLVPIEHDLDGHGGLIDAEVGAITCDDDVVNALPQQRVDCGAHSWLGKAIDGLFWKVSPGGLLEYGNRL